jgi:hypothetical protein
VVSPPEDGVARMPPASRPSLALDAGKPALFLGGFLMSFLDKLERLFGGVAVRNLSRYLIIGQVAFVLASIMQVVRVDDLVYWPGGVMMGQWWRLITFIFVVPVPDLSNLLGFVFLVFGWSLFYTMGNALEGQWGAFRFNLFLFVSYVLTIALSFITPRYEVSNAYILGSVFIAFAYLYPDFEILLFMILPVRVKWLALITVVFGAYRFIVGSLPTRLQIAGPIVAFLLFFGRDILRTIQHGQRTRTRRAEKAAEESKPRHVCYVCGKTDRSHPQLDFRYCSRCAGDQCYCPEHIQNHAHVVAADDRKQG